MARSKIPFLALLLLLFAHYIHTFVLLTANIEDVKKIARKFVSEPLAEQIAQFIVKASDQGTGANVSAENERNAGEVQDVSENELDQFPKAARQKYPDTKNDFNRYKQQTQPTSPKTPSKIEFAEDTSEITNPSEVVIKYKKKNVMPISSEVKKRKPKPKQVGMKEEPNLEPKEELTDEPKVDSEILFGDETTTRPQKRWKWKKKESEDDLMQEDRHKKIPAIKQQRLRKKKARQSDFDDEDLFQLVHRDDNKTMKKIPTNLPSSAVPNYDKNYAMVNRNIEKLATRQQSNRYTKPHDYTSHDEETYASKYRLRNDRHSLAEASEEKPMEDYLVTSKNISPIDTPKLSSNEIHFKDNKDAEPAENNTVSDLTKKVNAFNIVVGVSGLDRKAESKRKSYLVATSGPVGLPRISLQEQAQYRRRGGSNFRPQQVHQIIL